MLLLSGTVVIASLIAPDGNGDGIVVKMCYVAPMALALTSLGPWSSLTQAGDLIVDQVNNCDGDHGPYCEGGSEQGSRVE